MLAMPLTGPSGCCGKQLPCLFGDKSSSLDWQTSGATWVGIEAVVGDRMMLNVCVDDFTVAVLQSGLSSVQLETQGCHLLTLMETPSTCFQQGFSHLHKSSLTLLHPPNPPSSDLN